MTHSSAACPPPSNFSSVIDGINRELKQKGHLIAKEEMNGEGGEIEEGASSAARRLADNHQLITEMRGQNFDVIRFATYRTACKLRFVQRRTNLYLVDIWNVLEALRESGLTAVEGHTELPISALWGVVTTIYDTLNKRLPNSAQICVDESVTLLCSLLVGAYDANGSGVMRALSIKASLTILCAGKLVDKIKYAFSLVSDANGSMIQSRFDNYLREVLALPAAVFEGLSFEYSDSASLACFDRMAEVTATEFIETMTTEPGPECLMWLPILHRLASVENVHHPVQCEGCRRESFAGFRYKCQRCYNYQLCQDCFWHGKTTGNHSNEHEVKEYSFYKSPAKQLEHSLKKSMRCVPSRSPSLRSNGSSGSGGLGGVGGGHGGGLGGPGGAGGSVRSSRHAVDSDRVTNHSGGTPQLLRNGLGQQGVGSQSPQINGRGEGGRGEGVEAGGRGSGRTASLDRSSLKCNTLPPYQMRNQSPCRATAPALTDSGQGDDEHRLIARYTARLAADVIHSSRSPCELGYGLDSNRAQRELVAQLEQKNRDIMREILRLRREQEAQNQTVLDRSAAQQRNPLLLAELRLLRQRRDELEGRMGALQDSRNELMVQLEGLMKLLRATGSPRSGHSTSPRYPAIGGSHPANQLPRNNRASKRGSGGGVDSLTATGDHIMEAFCVGRSGPGDDGGGPGGNSLCNMRNHLFVAADSVTDAMSSLVRELNSEVSSASEEDEESAFRRRWGGNGEEVSTDEFVHWQREMQDRLVQERQFLDELHRHRYAHSDGSQSLVGGMRQSDAEIWRKADEESYIGKTDDEDNELYDRDPLELQQLRYEGGVGGGRGGRDEEGCLETDQESYIRTDDEDGSNTDWEDAARRWVNR